VETVDQPGRASGDGNRRRVTGRVGNGLQYGNLFQFADIVEDGRCDVSQCQTLPARAGQSHSIVNEPEKSFIFNGALISI